jgi:hypothetical protein
MHIQIVHLFTSEMLLPQRPSFESKGYFGGGWVMKEVEVQGKQIEIEMAGFNTTRQGISVEKNGSTRRQSAQIFLL